MGPVTAMVNNMMEILADVPPMLASGWVVWFIAGGALVFWYRRAVELEYAPATPRPAVRAVKPASRASFSAHKEASPVIAAAETENIEEAPSQLYEPPPAVAPVVARERKPLVIGDPFGDLATLLDQPPSAAPAVAPSSYRTTNDSPILSSAGLPIRRANDTESI
jgi:hypothetical protein